MLSFFALLSLLPFIAAQSNDTTLQIQAIQAHFANSGIVPSPSPPFPPLPSSPSPLTASVPSHPANLCPKTVKPTPNVSVTPANSTVQLGSNFTLAMVDAGPVGTDESQQGQTRHWLVNSVTLTGSSTNETVNTANGVAVTEYAGPAPMSGSGPHRYVILLFSQPSAFSPPANLSTPNVGVSVFNVNDYVQTSGLGPIVAATYMTVEVGTASFTPSATSAVVTSTLPADLSTSASGSAPSSSSSGVSTNGAIGLTVTNLGLYAALSAGVALAF